MKKILIIQTAFLGDCILASSILETLHKVFKNAKIDLLLRKGNENVYLNHPFLNNLYIWDKKKNKYKNLFKIINNIREVNYDVVFNLQRFFSTGLLTFLSKAKCKINFNKNPFSILSTISVKHNLTNNEKKLEYIHEIDRNHKLVTAYLKYLKIEKNVLVSIPKLYPSIIEYKKILKILNEIYNNKNFCIKDLYKSNNLINENENENDNIKNNNIKINNINKIKLKNKKIKKI